MREVRLSLSGPVVPLAEAAARHAGARSAADALRRLSREPRSGREHRLRPAAAPDRVAGAAARADRAACCSVRRRRCCFRGRSSPRRRRSCTSPTTRPSCAMPISAGRQEFLRSFRASRSRQSQACLPRTGRRVHVRAKQARSERARAEPSTAYALHRDLLHLRRDDPVIRAPGRPASTARCSLPNAFVLRYLGGADGDRLLIVNLGCDLDLAPMPEPLLAPPPTAAGGVLWSSESPTYGGSGTRAARSRIRDCTCPASRPCCSARKPDRFPTTRTRPMSADLQRIVRRPPAIRSTATIRCRAASGSSPTASAAMRRAPSPASSRGAITGCSSPRCRRRSAAS